MRVSFKMLFLKIIKRVSERYEIFIFEHRWISKELDSDLRPVFVFRLRKQVPDKTYRPKGLTCCHAGNLQWEDKVYGHPRFNRLLISVIMLSLFTYTPSRSLRSWSEENGTWEYVTFPPRSSGKPPRRGATALEHLFDRKQGRGYSGRWTRLFPFATPRPESNALGPVSESKTGVQPHIWPWPLTLWPWP